MRVHCESRAQPGDVRLCASGRLGRPTESDGAFERSPGTEPKSHEDQPNGRFACNVSTGTALHRAIRRIGRHKTDANGRASACREYEARTECDYPRPTKTCLDL